MHWSLWILIGATVNALNNLGYKIFSAKGEAILAVSMVMAVAAVVLFGYATVYKGLVLKDVASPKTLAMILAMGLATPLIVIFLLNAFSSGGPITLVDPMWACVYTLISGIIGMIILREAPSATALAGVGLYLVGAFLMARG